LTSATLKKAVLRLHPARWLCGFVDSAHLRGPGPLTCLLPEGQAHEVDATALQAVYFVTDFAQVSELAAPPRRAAAALPGLRVRVRTRGGVLLEGILATDLLALSGGLDLTPAHAESAWQRLFVPASALVQVLPLAMVRPPRRRRGQPPLSGQFPLFQTGAAQPEKEVE
jgi:hypothetical protein